MVSSKPFVGTSPRTNIYLLLLPASTDELFSTPKIKTFLSQSKSGYDNGNKNQIQDHVQNKNIYLHQEL